MAPIRVTIKKVKETLSRYGMIDPGDLVIVAVSGGPDSVCLLDILHELKAELAVRLVVAHYNHGLRGGEDESETRFVRHLASAMNFPFETENASFFIEGKTASLEERARNARYEFLERLKGKLHAQKIAMGHHLNDQAETVLMRLLRGSGPSGLAGIPPKRDDTIIRPLIELKREEIDSYVKRRELSYRVDRSNFDTRYLRNKIRLELLPLLLEYQPQFVEHLGQLAVILREDDKYLETEAEKWVGEEAEVRDNEEILIPVSSFTKLSTPLRNRVTRNILMQIGKSLHRIDQGHIVSVFNLALGKKPQATISLPNGLAVKRIYDRLAFTKKSETKSGEFHYLFDSPGSFYLEQIGLSISLTQTDTSPLPAPAAQKQADLKWTAYLDAEKLRYPLIIRNSRRGDRFVPLGMKGQKKIKDFFIDLKIPSEIRDSIPILVSEGIPVWICGYRIDERFKVTPDTKKILEVIIT